MLIIYDCALFKRFISFLLLIGLCSVASTLYAQSFTETKLTIADGKIDDRFATEVSLSGERALIGFHEDLNGKGSALIYELQDNGTWLEIAKLVASDGEEHDFFGRWVSLEGNRALVSTNPNTSLETSSVYIFERQPDGSWLEMDKLNEAGRLDQDGNVMMVGNIGASSSSAVDSVSVFERQFDGTWKKTAKLTANNNSFFGISISISGRKALIGSLHGAHLFERQRDGSWIEIQEFLPPQFDSNFGTAVALLRDEVYIGAPGHNLRDGEIAEDAGIVFIYERQADNSWTQHSVLVASDRSKDDRFGRTLSFTEDFALIGGPTDEAADDPGGSVYLFKKGRDGRWHEIAKLKASDPDKLDAYGSTVSVSQDWALIGAWGDDREFFNMGAAYLYDLSDEDTDQIGSSKNRVWDMRQEMDNAEYPVSFSLDQNHPNPFNPSTTIRLSLTEQAFVRLTVYDMLGREIERLVEGNLEAGKHEVIFVASGLPSGIYLYRLETPEGSFVQKMQLLK